jgi:hypothetical protein
MVTPCYLSQVVPAPIDLGVIRERLTNSWFAQQAGTWSLNKGTHNATSGVEKDNGNDGTQTRGAEVQQRTGRSRHTAHNVQQQLQPARFMQRRRRGFTRSVVFATGSVAAHPPVRSFGKGIGASRRWRWTSWRSRRTACSSTSRCVCACVRACV